MISKHICLSFYLSLIVFSSSPVVAEDPVHFNDANLKAVVEAALGKTNPTPTDMLAFDSLWASGHSISDLTGIEYATNLEGIGLDDNQISDLSPLSGLINLHVLFLNRNQISNIAPLSGLMHLQELELSNNQISNISPFSSLTNLQWLHLYANALDRDAYCQDMQAIRDANPGIDLSFSQNGNPPGGVTASDGTYADRVQVTWQPLCPGPGSTQTFQYVVYRSDSSHGAKTAISGDLSGTSFDDMNVEPGIYHLYWVKSSNAVQFSEPDGGFADELRAPEALFTLLPAKPRVKELIEFDASTSNDPDGMIVCYEWDFGDGTRADGVKASHTYQNAGRYSVGLKVTDNNGLVGAASTVVAVCGCGTLRFGDPSGDGEINVIDVRLATNHVLGDLLLSGERFCAADVDANGEVTADDVKLIIDYSLGLIDGFPADIICAQGPEASFTFLPAKPRVKELIEVDASTSKDLDGTIVRYEWDFGDGTHAEGVKASHTYQVAGRYLVKLRVLDDDGLAGLASIAIVATGCGSLRFGDPSGDGEINVGDIVRIVNHVLGTWPLTDEALCAGDVDADGEMTERDRELVLQYILGLTHTFPADDLYYWRLMGGIRLPQYAHLCAQWKARNCVDPDWCHGADMDRNGRVDFPDLEIMAEHWLDGATGDWF
jgi:PKD repeat protein